MVQLREGGSRNHVANFGEAAIGANAARVIGDSEPNAAAGALDGARESAIVDDCVANALDSTDAIERALTRLEKGTYGHCEACGVPIEDGRLEARPEARLCMADQRAAEEESHRLATRP